MAGLHYKFSKLNFKQVVVTTPFLHQVSLSTHFWWSSRRSEGVQPCSHSSDGKPLVCHDDICQGQHSAPPSDSSRQADSLSARHNTTKSLWEMETRRWRRKEEYFRPFLLFAVTFFTGDHVTRRRMSWLRAETTAPSVNALRYNFPG